MKVVRTPLVTAISMMAMTFSVTAGDASQDSVDKGSVELPRVTVTGQKIERDVTETVSSVEVYSAEEISSSTGSNDLFDVLDRTPNVSRTASFDFAIRGVESTGPTGANGSASTIGVYVDGAIQSSFALQSGALSVWDFDNIQVLRGPQSTTAGRNSLAGAVILKTADPEFEKSGRLRLSYGQYNTYQTAFSQTGGLTDDLAYRLSADYQYSDNFVTNENIDGDEWDREGTATVRGKLLKNLSGGGEVLLTVSRTEMRDFGDDSVYGDQPRGRNTFNSESTWFTDVNNFSIEVMQPINDQLSFTSNTAFTRAIFDRQSDADGRDGEAVVNQDSAEFNFSQEFSLNYTTDTLRSVAGLYLSKGELDDQFFTTRTTIAYDPLPETLLNIQSATLEQFENIAIFTDADYSLTNKLTVLSGIRLDYEVRKNSISSAYERLTDFRESYGEQQGAFVNASYDQVGAALSGGESGRKESFTVLPKIGVNYQWNDALTSGFIIQRGYRPGGVSTNIARAEAKEFDAEYTQNYELSTRYTSFDNRFFLAANVFYTDWKDQQVTVRGDRPFDSFIENAGRSHLYGVELSTDYQVTPELLVAAGVGYTRTEFDEFNNGADDYAGEEFPNARKWTSNINATYRGSQGIFATANASYASEGANEVGTEDTMTDMYVIANIKVGYESQDWGVFLYGNNIFDREYRTERYEGSDPNSTSDDTRIYGDPRVVGITADLHW